MDAYYVRLARETLRKAISALEDTQEYLARAGQCEPQIDRLQTHIRRLQKDQKTLAVFLREALVEWIQAFSQCHPASRKESYGRVAAAG